MAADAAAILQIIALAGLFLLAGRALLRSERKERKRERLVDPAEPSHDERA
ncbi:hypothetical protein [Actinomadura rugatobispora]|uniref:Uncharacterized protein n=1 Tax=Actinomadura rugatobispora TaxID=1994 RepID=A0ABW1AF23_9ACTN|nr:hypothetical protein GCM10010200_033020 [Actinomadura rugatobispora]